MDENQAWTGHRLADENPDAGGWRPDCAALSLWAVMGVNKVQGSMPGHGHNPIIINNNE